MRDKRRATDPDIKKNILGITLCSIILICAVLGTYGPNSPKPHSSPQFSEKQGLNKLPITYHDNAQGCWEAEDSLYDFDSQARLIALTNAYYTYLDNPDVLEQIAYKAIETRNAAGILENDCLTEPVYIDNLGKALDKAATEGTLSYSALQKLQEPYVSISKENTADAETLVFSFGKVDITVRIVRKVLFNGEVTMFDDVVYLTSTAHYLAYVIYLPEFEYSRTDTLSALAGFGYSKTDICTVEAFSEEKFAGAWNSVGPAPSGANVSYVFILTHAQPDELYGKQFRFSTYAIESLKEIQIEALILYGCSAGHFGYSESNPAAALSEKISGGLVLASDSTVYYEPNDDGVLTYTPITDDTFTYFIETNGRESMGWLVYKYRWGKIKVYYIGSGSLTAMDMLEFLNIAHHMQEYPLIY